MKRGSRELKDLSSMPEFKLFEKLVEKEGKQKDFEENILKDFSDGQLQKMQVFIENNITQLDDVKIRGQKCHFGEWRNLILKEKERRGSECVQEFTNTRDKDHAQILSEFSLSKLTALKTYLERYPEQRKKISGGGSPFQMKIDQALGKARLVDALEDCRSALQSELNKGKGEYKGMLDFGYSRTKKVDALDTLIKVLSGSQKTKLTEEQQKILEHDKDLSKLFEQAKNIQKKEVVSKIIEPTSPIQRKNTPPSLIKKVEGNPRPPKKETGLLEVAKKEVVKGHPRPPKVVGGHPRPK